MPEVHKVGPIAAGGLMQIERKLRWAENFFLWPALLLIIVSGFTKLNGWIAVNSSDSYSTMIEYIDAMFKFILFSVIIPGWLIVLMVVNGVVMRRHRNRISAGLFALIGLLLSATAWSQVWKDRVYSAHVIVGVLFGLYFLVGVWAFAALGRASEQHEEKPSNPTTLGGPNLTESPNALVSNGSQKPTAIGALKFSAARSPMTLSLIGVLTAIACVQFGLFLSAVLNPDSGAINLVTVFGIQGQRIWHNHEWWRLLTGPLIHLNLAHLVFNCLALFFTGILLEHVLGWRWIALLFALCGVGGAYASLLFNPPAVFGVGASGAIMGLLGATFVMAFRFPNGPVRNSLFRRSLQMIIPTLIPSQHIASNTVIDYAAHLGGLSVGVVVAAAILLANWAPEKSEPTLGWPAACGAVAVLLFGFVLAANPPKPATAADVLADAAQAIDNKDYQRALELLTLPAVNGNALAQTDLGWIYDNGFGVAQDYGKARTWFEMAARQGNPSAEFNLGVMYANGHGVDVDLSIAAKWYKMAADQGDADAQFSLGKLYEKGDGVVWDLDQANKLYQSAAEGGNEDAKRALATQKTLKP